MLHEICRLDEEEKVRTGLVDKIIEGLAYPGHIQSVGIGPKLKLLVTFRTVVE